jgi:alpha-glucosidase
MESPEKYDICLPKGGWYDYWTGRPADASTITEAPKLDYLPVFVRAGTILPREPLVQSTSQTPNGPLYLDVYPGADCEGTIYLDDGHSMRFQNGDYLRQAIRCGSDARGLSITFGQRQGTFRPWWTQIEVRVHGRSAPSRVIGTTGPLQSRYDSSRESVEFTIADLAACGTIRVESGL